jgi:UDP-glucuronate 4-epimerase
MTVLVTGAAGFIGYHTAARLLERGEDVVGVDNFSDYYDPALKEARAQRLTRYSAFQLLRADLSVRSEAESVFAEVRPQRVIHLAAQAGVRHSIRDPHAYIAANLVGFLHILEGCRHAHAEHLTFASTSSVYGGNTSMPFRVNDGADHPLTLYAATKRSNELMAHSYAHLYGLPVTGLRFFTVYGPWGRPDMALFRFTKAILAGQPIEVYNYGRLERDFTYIDDIVTGIVAASDRPAVPDGGWDSAHPAPGSSSAPFRLYNIGNSRPTNLLHFIEEIERAIGIIALKKLLPMEPGDVPATWADVTELSRDMGYSPGTPIELGVPEFVRWYRAYYGV